MRILLLGGAGFIGLNLALALLRDGHEVHIADAGGDAQQIVRVLAGRASLVSMAAHQTSALLKLIDQHEFDCVVSLASSLLPSSPLEAFQTEVRELMLPVFALVEALAERGTRFVYFSSGGTIYGPGTREALHEGDELAPINHYGVSKLIFETYLAFAARTRGLQHMILRPSNPFGTFQNPARKQGLIAVAVDKALHGKPLEIWGDGSVVRDYLWVEDLAQAFCKLLHSPAAWGQVLNVGSGQGHSICEVLAEVQLLTGRVAEIRYHPARAVDVPHMVLDISRLRQTIPFEPRTLREALTLYIDGLKKT